MTETPNPHIINADTLTGEMRPIRRAVLAVGSNLGERMAMLQGAVNAIADTPDVWVTGISPVYETEPVDSPEDARPYLNAVVLIDTTLAANRLMDRALAVEDAFERERSDVPNAPRSWARLPYRQEWDRDFLAYLKKLKRRKPVVFCGDFNVAHTEIDLANPKSNKNTHGFTAEERAGFDAFVKAGFVDSFREFEPAGGHYTWWSNLNNARARNVGWRIDYFMVSANLRPRLKKAFILSQVMGSDHCPVGIELA